jgi:hypothetical protein
VEQIDESIAKEIWYTAQPVTAGQRDPSHIHFQYTCLVLIGDYRILVRNVLPELVLSQTHHRRKREEKDIDKGSYLHHLVRAIASMVSEPSPIISQRQTTLTVLFCEVLFLVWGFHAKSEIFFLYLHIKCSQQI